MKQLDFITRRIIAWPALAIGFVLTVVGGWLIMLASWLTDNEDLIRGSHDLTSK